MKNRTSPRRIIWASATSLVLVASIHARQEAKVARPAQPAAKIVTPSQGVTPGQPAKKAMKMGSVSQGARKKRTPPTTEELKKRYEKVLEGAWIAKGNWILDYDEARARAKREGKLIFVYFSRSYSP